MTDSPIIISTARTTLHQFSAADAQGFYHLNRNIENIRFTGDQPFDSVAQAAQFIAAYNHYQQYGFGRWSVYLKGNKNQQQAIDKPTYIGFCGLRKNPQNGLVDIGYRIDQKYWGLGLATETARAAVAYGFEQLSLPIIVSRSRVDNPASIAVLTKIGFIKSAEEIEDGQKWSVFELKKLRWVENQQK